MQKPLIIAEKPGMAADIARALGGFHKDPRGFWESSEYTLASAFGHIVTLKEPEDYTPTWERWSLRALPIIPEQFGLKAIPRQARQFSLLSALLKDAALAINACDAGREGELIFRWICELAGYTGPVQRLWVSSLTPTAIREGFAALRDSQEYDDLAAAARCRSQGDWLVGINATRALTVKHRELLTVGRVQTPTLAMLVAREKEIRDFNARSFWVVKAEFSVVNGNYQGRWFRGRENRVWSAREAEAIRSRVQGNPGVIKKLEAEERREVPPLLWDLTSLQREGNRRWGFSAARTLSSAQKLYERHKLITYPRTNSRYLTADLAPSFGQRLKSLAQGGYGELASPLLPKPPRLSGRFINPGKVRDHHAIIPTEKKPGGLEGDEARLYDLIARRFLAAFYPPCLWKETKVITTVECEEFESKGKELVSPGWRQVEGAGNEQLLPALTQGETAETVNVQVEEEQTKPPVRYTEGTLLAAMEGAGKLVEEDELREAMKDAGLGTPATRASIIERLKQVGYVREEGRKLVPTAKGQQLIGLVARQELVSPELTGIWEKRLSDMELGREDSREFMADAVNLARSIVSETAATAREEINKPVQEPLGKCPLCGGDVIEGKRAYGCRNWRAQDGGCKFAIWKTIAKKHITSVQARQLLEEGKTPRLRGFVSSKGKNFSAALVLQGGKIQFDFQIPHRQGTRPPVL